MANFLHRHIYGASSHYLMSILAIDPVCPQTILRMRVTLFPSGMLCVINIPSINGNDTLFYSELSENTLVKVLGRLRLILFEIC